MNSNRLEMVIANLGGFLAFMLVNFVIMYLGGLPKEMHDITKALLSEDPNLFITYTEHKTILMLIHGFLTVFAIFFLSSFFRSLKLLGKQNRNKPMKKIHDPIDDINYDL